MLIYTGLVPCDLTILDVKEDRVDLKDNCSGMTITNAAEHVTKAIHTMCPGKRIFYYDIRFKFATHRFI